MLLSKMDSNIVKKFNGYRSLEKIKPKGSQQYAVIAYFLVEKPSENNGVYGMFIFLQAFEDPEVAKNFRNLVNQTANINSIIVTNSCQWRDLSIKCRSDQIDYKPIDLSRKLAAQHAGDIEREKILRMEEFQRIEAFERE